MEKSGLTIGIPAAVPDNSDMNVTVVVTDADGDTASKTTTVHVDKTPPPEILTWSPAVDNGVLHGVATVTALNVPADLGSLTLIKGNPAPGMGTVVARATSAPWQLTFDTTKTSGPWWMTVADKAGNSATYNINWRIDNSGPR